MPLLDDYINGLLGGAGRIRIPDNARKHLPPMVQWNEFPRGMQRRGLRHPLWTPELLELGDRPFNFYDLPQRYWLPTWDS